MRRLSPSEHSCYELTVKGLRKGNIRKCEVPTIVRDGQRPLAVIADKFNACYHPEVVLY